MPTIYGYVFEEQPERVIGFVMQYLSGSHAGPGDLNDCIQILKSIHRLGSY